MTSEEQEALSRKYSNDVVMLLILRNGSIAVFNAARELQSICRADDLRLHVMEVKPPAQSYLPPPQTVEVEFDL
jgi:hypothetical protein